MADLLEVQEGAQYQSADEQLAYSITTTAWASNPTNVSVKVFEEPGDKDVTTTVFPTNSPGVSGDVITLSLLKNLTKGKLYRIEIQFTVGSNVWEGFFRVKCEI